SCIAAVPRYACEAFRAIWSTDSATAPPEYARRCAERGIRHPAGMELQDFGWVAHPRVGWEHIEFVTWQDYFRRFDQAPRPQLPVTQERFLGFLPFGAEYLQKVGRAERELENRLPATEKLCALASVFAGRAYPADELKRAWIHLFDAQHHDAWAVANGSPPDALGPIGYKTAKREPSHLRDVSPNLRLTWSDQGAEGCRAGLAVCDHLTQAAAESLASVAAGTGADDKSVWVRVFNTAGAARREVAQAAVVAPPGTLAVRVSNAEGRTVPSQFLPTRKFHDADTLRRMSARGAVHPAEDAPPEDRLAPGESFTSGLVLFPAEVPTLGFATYRIEFLSTVESAAPTNGARTVRDAEGRLVIETDLYRIVLDPRKGGAATGLLAKDLGQELCDAASAYAFHELRGYFINENAWLTSAASPARLEVIEIGPLRVRVVIRGAIGKHPFESMLTVVQGQRPIEFTTRLSFAPDVKIGDPWADGEGGADDRMRRSAHNARPKLSVLFPTVLRDARLYKDAAFDVCESRHADAFFTRWTEGKHNIVVNWLDVFDAARKTGLALATDHTTTYVQGDGVPPGLTLGWNWKDNQQPHKHGVFTDRPKIVRYAVWPHPGRWDEARLWQQNTLRAEPPLTQVMAAAPEPEASRRSLVQVEQDAFEIVTVRVAGRDLFIRLFNAESNAPPKTVTLMFKPQRADLVELDGRVIAELPLREAAGRYEVQVAMPRFGFRTLRLCGILRE
ncbi:MAG: hypothetical protein FJ388_14565, partial [Verrucomicrobia bacterium]|nr:hypothetical protein [Verrucomicrobiota bacterium]